MQGIAVNALGHCHPAVVEAICAQTKRLINGSFNMANFEPTLTLAKKLSEIAPGELGCTFFSNSGAEANDGAMKLAKAYTKRPSIIAFKGSFHGRTIGAISVTASNAKYRKYYEPHMGGVYFAPFPSRDICPKGLDEEQRSEYCLNEVKSLFSYVAAPETVAAILVEPVQGEGGYVVPPKSFLKGLRALCDQYGILLIFDEVQSGYGRTGKMFAGENFDVVPDIMTLGKAMAGGLPMSAIVSTPAIMDEWHAGMHGTTFGGNPVAAASALAVLDQFEKLNLLENVNTVGGYMKGRLLELQKKYPFMYDVRGLGLMLAVEYAHADGTPAPEIWATCRKACLDAGMMTLNCGVNGNGQRFATPLNITLEEADKVLEIFETGLKAV
ncbi:4-aminobutyrate aminotransferase PuuE [bioreactor metagenome]|uniref:4-aminobutyrate aminotransferase PuuE n=1 Tax=bioreactor metagenome TaxID=1076179 RepID=A0A645ATX3_9ZZZZ